MTSSTYSKGGTKLLKGGTKLLKGGTKLLKGGTKLLKGGTKLLKGGTKLLKGGTKLLKGGTKLLKGGTKLLKGGTKLLKGGTKLLKGGTKLLKGGTKSLGWATGGGVVRPPPRPPLATGLYMYCVCARPICCKSEKHMTYGVFTPEQDNDKTTTRQKLKLCIPMMPFTPDMSGQGPFFLLSTYRKLR